jgi:leucyl aminopeptidase
VATLSITMQDPSTVGADALVLAVVSDSQGARLLPQGPLPPQIRAAVEESFETFGVTGAAGEVTRVPAPPQLRARVLVLTGMGPAQDDVTGQSLRRAAGAVTRSLGGLDTVVLALPTGDADRAAAVAEGALLGSYRFDRYRSVPTPAAKRPVDAVTVCVEGVDEALLEGIVTRSQVLAAAVHDARDLVNTSPADLYPETFAAHAVEAAQGLPVEVTVLDENALAESAYGGLIAVGMGSARPPRLVRLDYCPQSAQRHLALVGKGITFDSGGLSLKPAKGMEDMKSDMAGAAAVLNAVLAAARLQVPVRVTGWLALAENMPSGTAQRPSDVITIRGGKTVEVTNTDAEGRLVLADALVAACETGPDAIVDIATLTGAQVVALGNLISAVMANDDAFRDRVCEAARAAGERAWPMPLPPEMRPSLDSSVADIGNVGDRAGGMLAAGLFLSEFVAPSTGSTGSDGERSSIPWAHIDIAGPSFNTGKAHGCTPVGGTGVFVRSLVRLAEDIADREL